MTKLDLSEMRNKWPSIFCARQQISTFTGGAMSEKYLANLDCQGKGPKGRSKIGRKVVYRVNDLIEWLESRS